MIFRSHFITMVIYTIIVSTILALVRFEKKEEIIKAGLKMFLMMTGGVIIFSWIMYLI